MPRGSIKTEEPTRILIACAGLGMGNASRVSAILESLSEQAAESHRNIDVHICSWGPGFRFLDEFRRRGSLKFELSELTAYPALHSLDRALSMRPLGQYFQAYLRNVISLRRLIRKWRPSLIILDSDYHFPAYFFPRSPIVFIGQACDVLDRAKIHSFQTRSWIERLNLNIRERLDSFIQVHLSRLVLVPSFTPGAQQIQNVSKIPLIARKEFTLSARPTDTPCRLGVLLSGSRIDQEEFLMAASAHDIPVVGPSAKTVPSSATHLDRFDVILTQGGLSSISECIARRRFLVVIPMRQHPEQMLNALEVERLGVGMRASQEELRCLPKLLERIAEKRAHANPIEIPCNGAQIAAKAISKILWAGYK